jgi:hypothetical protein
MVFIILVLIIFICLIYKGYLVRKTEKEYQVIFSKNDSGIFTLKEIRKQLHCTEDIVFKKKLQRIYNITRLFNLLNIIVILVWLGTILYYFYC